MPSRSLPSNAHQSDRTAGTVHAPNKRLTCRASQRIAAAAVLAATLLSGCAPVVVGSAVVGASALYDRRHYDIVIDDQQIELAALHALAQSPDIAEHARISATSYNRKVLLTGQAESEPIAQRAAATVSRLPKVEQIIDEITIGPELSLSQTSRDSYITSRAKLALTKIAIPDFNPTRVKVVTEDGVVYLMGLVTPTESDAAAEQIRYVPGVQRVVKLFETDATSA